MADVLDFPKQYNTKTARNLIESLGDFIKDSPDATVFCIVMKKDPQILSIGYTPASPETHLLMLEFGKRYWSKEIFESEFSDVYEEEEEVT